jgi:hypothetical protein
MTFNAYVAAHKALTAQIATATTLIAMREPQDHLCHLVDAHPEHEAARR